VSRAGQQVTVVGGQFSRVVGTGTPAAPQPISTLTPAGQATVTGTSNPTTAGLPDLTGFQVQIFTAEGDINLLQTAAGTAVVAPATTLDTGGTTTTSISTIGQDINANQNQPTCTPSSTTTCP
jgi:hypothetical protein